MAYTNSLHSSSLGFWDLHNLGFLNADITSSYHMENNAASLMLPTSDYNYSNNFLSTGYLEDALFEFSVRFKRRRVMLSSNVYGDYDQHHQHHHHHHHDHHDDEHTHFDDLSYWSNWFANYSMQTEGQEFSHASLLTHHDDMHYSLGEFVEKPVKGMYEEVVNYQETNTLLLEKAITSSPKIMDLSSFSKRTSLKSKFTNFAYNSDTNSTDSSSISVVTTDDEREKRKMKEVNTTKMVYPFGLVKPGGEEGDITLKDINRRILMPPTRPLKHPVGDFACRPAVSRHGPGLSGKAVVALTKIHTQGRGTITIIRTKG
ncbi:uncharacterized protein LOC104895328 isoform X2 [Beta vulgaris subsp. vulgaris]|uniref:uncharacterized protein LOC104895328 isoform X2 n=1 Tax=Beta vulgaris subsp. vulgaris TaxID=3555 RepID=UPI00053F3FC6|nr:uncharacterized protein LOC104895328 isoform X2 [Beta vulgaris subsp. vulgaris]